MLPLVRIVLSRNHDKRVPLVHILRQNNVVAGKASVKKRSESKLIVSFCFCATFMDLKQFAL